MILNGTKIADTDVKQFAGKRTPDGRDHPGLFNKEGYVAILGHGNDDHVELRSIRVKDLSAEAP